MSISKGYILTVSRPELPWEFTRAGTQFNTTIRDEFKLIDVPEDCAANTPMSDASGTVSRALAFDLAAGILARSPMEGVFVRAFYIADMLMGKG